MRKKKVSFDIVRMNTVGGLKYVVTGTVSSLEGEELTKDTFDSFRERVNEMSKKTTEDYYKFFSQDWKQSERTLMEMVQKEKRVGELRKLYFRDQKAPKSSLREIEARLGMMLYLILLQENKELEELRRFKETFEAVEERGSGFAFGLVHVLLDKIQEWVNEIAYDGKSETITNMLLDMQEQRETMRDLLKKMGKK